jgi:hypothetical protein
MSKPDPKRIKMEIALEAVVVRAVPGKRNDY